MQSTDKTPHNSIGQ